MKVVIDIKEKHLDEAVRMLWDYFSLKVTRNYVERIVKSDSRLLFEVRDGAVTDTMVRDLFIDVICDDLEIDHWPMYKDGDAYSEKFYKSLAKATASKPGIKFVPPND